MAQPSSYIGAVIAVSVSTPATTDAAGFNALSYTTVGKIVSWGEVGDQSDNISIPLLEGRVEHVNGAKDGGEIPFLIRYDSAPDAGQAILIAQSNGNTTVSVKITDPDGKIANFFGLVANVRDQERNNSNFKGLSGAFRVNSATIRQ